MFAGDNERCFACSTPSSFSRTLAANQGIVELNDAVESVKTFLIPLAVRHLIASQLPIEDWHDYVGHLTHR